MFLIIFVAFLLAIILLFLRIFGVTKISLKWMLAPFAILFGWILFLIAPFVALIILFCLMGVLQS